MSNLSLIERIAHFFCLFLKLFSFELNVFSVPLRRRTANLQRGRQLLREGKVSEARECFTRSVSITPAMAHRLIKVIMKTISLLMWEFGTHLTLKCTHWFTLQRCLIHLERCKDLILF